jgi:hypothetical protein
MNPYIGVTGFSRPEEVSAALQAFPNNNGRKLMVGVLATYKSLRYIPMKPRWAKQTPHPSDIAGLFPDDERAVNLVHFSTEEGQENSVLADMFKIHELAGPNFHGFQLNVAWPQIDQMDDYRQAVGWNYRIVLQLGQKAVEMAGGTTRGVMDMLYHYASVVDDVLLDPSGGLGRPFDTERTLELLSAIAEQGWDIGLGVAGGLGPDSLNLVEPLIARFPNLSIDAQGRLRNAENELDPELVSAYLNKALQTLA